MKTPIGSKIQDLERLVVENLKETELVEHPHIYHGDLRKKDEPVSLSYKVTAYKRAGKYFDPLIQMFPLLEILQAEYSGVLEIQTNYDESTEVRTIKMKLVYCPIQDITQFKYEVLLKINTGIEKYLKEKDKRPAEKKKKTRK